MAGMTTRATKASATTSTSGKTKVQGRARGKQAPRLEKDSPTPRERKVTAGRRTKSGVTLTPQMEAELAAEAEAGYDIDKLTPRRVGRPSLSEEGGTSHRLSVRVDDQTFQMIRKVAKLTNRRPSELVREVLQAAYLRK